MKRFLASFAILSVTVHYNTQDIFNFSLSSFKTLVHDRKDPSPRPFKRFHTLLRC